MKFGFDWPSGFRVRSLKLENNGHIHVYYPEAGADNPLGQIFSINSINQSIMSFAASFPQLNYFVTVFPIQAYG